MRIFLGILFAALLFILSYPLAKNFQLCGYDLKFYFSHSYMLKYEFGGKNSLVFTKRMIRLICFYFLVLAGINLCCFMLISETWLIALCCVIELMALNLIFSICGLILLPFENLIKRFYIKKACKVLQNFKGIKIAITGSFGKTSTKNFLAVMLKQKYNVCITPRNFNTPMGLCKTALEHLSSTDEVLIVEMGARHKGDINELMDMLKPKYGIITAIGEQHLETFGDIDTVIATKYELCEKLGSSGLAVFDGSNEIAKKLYKRFCGEKYLAGDPSGPIYIQSAQYSSNGAKLKLILNGEKHVVQTEILGEKLINDIVVAATMASVLGVDDRKILKAIKMLKPAPHRLQLLKNGDMTIIDDAYNSNLEGGRQACECLKLFKGKRIIVSPGLVEQGDKQYELNFKLGKMFGESCDELIIMNETNKTSLLKGAMSVGMKEEHIHFAQTRKQQQELLSTLHTKDSVILFENDLPDNYK